MSEPIVIDKKTPVLMTVGTMLAIVAFVALTVFQAVQIMNKLDSFHADCVRLYDQSWHIKDEAERVHQLRELHGQEPDLSEVLRVSRPNEKQQ